MPLALGSVGEVYSVKKIGGTDEVRQHLYELGLNVGSPVSIVSSIDGNVIVKVKESRIAIDRRMASKIVV